MADRSLRGMRIGTQSMETEDGVEFAERREAIYDCPDGHVTILPFSVEADVPSVWQCRCGMEAQLRGAEASELKSGKPQRTHWDMLLERRSEEELQVLLDERLTLLRSGKLRRRSHVQR